MSCLSRLPSVLVVGSLIGLACSAHQAPPPAPPPSQSLSSGAPTPSAPPPAPADPVAPAGGVPVSIVPSGPEVGIAAGPGWSIITTAPEGMTASDLGRVFDSAFQPLAGQKAMFKTKAPEGYPVFRHSVALVEDRITLAATVRSWGLTTDAGRKRRFASYRAEQITEIHAVDDMAPPDSAPDSATYYLAKVYYGRSFEVRLSGEEKQFHSGLAGVFLSGKLDGGLKSFAEKNRLEFTAVGRGLRPKSGTAIYAKEPGEIEQNYTADGSVAVPVEVEYRLIPGRSLPSTEPILWHKQSRYRVELSAVEARACDKTSA